MYNFYVLQHKKNQTIIIFHLSFYLKSTRENVFLCLASNFRHNENGETYTNIERLQIQLPIFCKREQSLGDCSLTVALFDKDKHIVKYRTTSVVYISITHRKLLFRRVLTYVWYSLFLHIL